MAQWTKIVEGIRIAKISKKANSAGSTISYHYIPNDDRPDKAHTTEGLSGLARMLCFKRPDHHNNSTRSFWTSPYKTKPEKEHFV